MKKCISLVLLLTLLITACGCGGASPGTGEYHYYIGGEKPKQQDYSGQIISFVYRFEQELGPSGRFELIKDNDAAILRVWKDYYHEGDEPYERRVDLSALQDLKELIDRSGLAQYHGIVQDSGITIHSSFLLEVKYDNGAELLTYGDHYPNAHDELSAFFMRLTAQYN
ncbi:MAG: hypothetical protein FWE41_03870 [Coriobacteriia bacterium]|nr:hypothetical protein [Coriobacteriia bacterium]MCL2750482.1 hypothetical protein [Coriobacteriia bacterium]